MNLLIPHLAYLKKKKILSQNTFWDLKGRARKKNYSTFFENGSPFFLIISQSPTYSLMYPGFFLIPCYSPFVGTQDLSCSLSLPMRQPALYSSININLPILMKPCSFLYISEPPDNKTFTMPILLHFFIALLRNAYFLLISVDPKSTFHQILFLVFLVRTAQAGFYTLRSQFFFRNISLCHIKRHRSLSL